MKNSSGISAWQLATYVIPKVVIFGLLPLQLLSGLAYANAEKSSSSAPVLGTPVQDAPTSQLTASELFAAHAHQGGAKRCAASYASLGNALVGATPFTVQTQTNKIDPGNHGILGVVGMNFQSSTDGGYSGPAAGVVMTVPNGSVCEGSMVRIVPFAQHCAAVVALLPKGSHQLPPLSGLVTASLPDGSQALLLPSGNGCIVISLLRTGQ